MWRLFNAGPSAVDVEIEDVEVEGVTGGSSGMGGIGDPHALGDVAVVAGLTAGGDVGAGDPQGFTLAV